MRTIIRQLSTICIVGGMRWCRGVCVCAIIRSDSASSPLSLSLLTDYIFIWQEQAACMRILYVLYILVHLPLDIPRPQLLRSIVRYWRPTFFFLRETLLALGKCVFSTWWISLIWLYYPLLPLAQWKEKKLFLLIFFKTKLLSRCCCLLKRFCTSPVRDKEYTLEVYHEYIVQLDEKGNLWNTQDARSWWSLKNQCSRCGLPLVGLCLFPLLLVVVTNRGWMEEKKGHNARGL